ncbi:F0F1 ATP synthase subunit B [Jannaschia sp. CCS1]|uniref:ATP synthase subunit b 1 n=1 Tax=Jannaschia sp. (strain CCS1) TaxID=290400 RepID=ATPF1_JANSC|nr:F0F1 ATP synthase subunit B [Jannaschia sp. CCS1]Q28UC5.1 RecName: Full=ATP synthase subunit b 1; AltName: Full=ATP synthase F(0) sector subunit b 1; AltName: Full=ATPase subunit I 1; AltName: Full=F-type ATPase subunit b 1; Short=F-ATPase subunit b 1 [Jannaschia sp. CCS1]ABD53687.1 ATP synthase F0 subcomplex B subunit [Jannaschia sp. CCS1]
MRYLTALFVLVASPALAAGDDAPKGLFNPSLGNTDFVVLLGFLLFLAILFYFGVPKMLGGMLDARAEGIRSELDEARALREEAQTLLASYERKAREVEEQSARIVTEARANAETAAEQAKADIERSITRRLAAAEDQIASAEAKASRAVRDTAASVAVAAAAEVIAGGTSATDQNKMIDEAIEEVGRQLH